MIQTHGLFYESNNLVATNIIIQAEVDCPLNLLIADFGKYPIWVHKNQVVAGFEPNLTDVTQGPFTISEVLGTEDVPKWEQNITQSRETKSTKGLEDSPQTQLVDTLHQDLGIGIPPLEAAPNSRIEPPPPDFVEEPAFGLCCVNMHGYGVVL